MIPKTTNKYRYYIKHIHNQHNNCNYKNPLKIKLDKYNLVNNKHIPVEYICNSKDIRLKVLAGIIDTDGSVSNNGRRVITNVLIPTNNKFDVLSNNEDVNTESSDSYDNEAVVVRTSPTQQSKRDSNSRFFIHSQLTDSAAANEVVNAPKEVIPLTDQCSQSSEVLSQSSMLDYFDGSSQQNKFVVHKLSMDQTAAFIQSTSAKNILIGDHNWNNFIPVLSDFNTFICSGKITALRAIIDKIKDKVHVDRLIICVSSNNIDSPTAISLLKNIFKGINDKFPSAKHFVCLSGICQTLTQENSSALEAINMLIRSKSDKLVIVNPPDNFTTTNGYSFTDETKQNFFESLNSFLV